MCPQRAENVGRTEPPQRPPAASVSLPPFMRASLLQFGRFYRQQIYAALPSVTAPAASDRGHTFMPVSKRVAELIILRQKWRQMSKNVIDVGLAIASDQSGTVLASRAHETLRDPAPPA